jgi:hypothetical protein
MAAHKRKTEQHWDYSKGNPPPDPEKTHKCNEIVLTGPETGKVCDKWFGTSELLASHKRTLIHVEDYDKYVCLRHHLEFKADSESHVTLSKCQKCGQTFRFVRPQAFSLLELILLISSLSRVN